MQIAIAGLGSSGSYLLRLLTNAGFNVSGFDPKREGFYIPCGYAANSNTMKDLLSLVDIEFSRYIESEAGEITFSGSSQKKVRFKSLGLVTFDKNRLEADLLKGCKWERKKLSGSFDLIVDATGISRYFLPAEDDYRMHTTEYLTSLPEKKDFQFNYFPKGSGYFWIFPMGDKYHVGAGSSSMSGIKESLSSYSAEKVVSRDIRLKPLLRSSYEK
ncbi:dehydrogenase (flavoprotein)-like protein, partial [mine drainage metagenome]